MSSAPTLQCVLSSANNGMSVLIDRPVRAPGRKAPLIRFLLSALYAVCLKNVHLFYFLITLTKINRF